MATNDENEKRAFAQALLRGEVRLLGIDEIAAKLGVSRSTLERWIANGAPLADKPSGMRTASDFMANNREGFLVFPKADLKVGKTFKWREESVVQWLMNNMEHV